jgi:thiamine biosynthesis lipoprotein ApbE
MRRLLLPALVSLALLAGCGSSSKSTSAPASTPTQTQSTAASGGAGATTSANTSPPANLAQAVQRCKQSVTAAPTLNASAKSKLESLCDQAAKGNTANLQKTAAQVCQQLIKSSVPAAEQATALANCPKP